MTDGTDCALRGCTAGLLSENPHLRRGPSYWGSPSLRAPPSLPVGDHLWIELNGQLDDRFPGAASWGAIAIAGATSVAQHLLRRSWSRRAGRQFLADTVLHLDRPSVQPRWTRFWARRASDILSLYKGWMEATKSQRCATNLLPIGDDSNLPILHSRPVVTCPPQTSSQQVGLLGLQRGERSGLDPFGRAG
jgi:hypothetical protein